MKRPNHNGKETSGERHKEGDRAAFTARFLYFGYSNLRHERMADPV